MPDVINAPYAERHADTSEPGVHLTFGEAEWAQWLRFTPGRFSDSDESFVAAHYTLAEGEG